MPNRVIKESICESEGLSECSLFACDLYKRLITYADDYGRFNSDTKIMRARLFPREYEEITEEDIILALAELAGVKKLYFYTTDRFNQGAKHMGVYGAFPNWSDHQRIRESKTKCPEPNDTDINDWYLRRFIPLDLRVEIVERDGFKCKICGKFLTSCREAKRFVKLGQGLYHIDHIVPVVQGGRSTEENLRLTCPECNMKRKKRFTFKEILEFDAPPISAASCGEVPQSAAIIQSNPIQKQSKSESKSENNARDAFEKFWSAYPRKAGSKQKAFEAFKKVDTPLDILLDAIENQKRSAQWSKDNGQFIPHPTTWLNGKRWEDEMTGTIIPCGALGQLGEAEEEAIRRILAEDVPDLPYNF
jgi:5-methylcytosine-specific restriction endonuclease McrA